MTRSGLVWSGLVWSGLVWSGLVWSGLVWSGLVWSGLVWSGLVWSGLVWSGLVWSGLVWSGLVWSGLVWSGLVWSGLVWSGLVWSGLVWSGLVWSGDKFSGLRLVGPISQAIFYLITSLQHHLRHSPLRVPLLSLQLANGMYARVSAETFRVNLDKCPLQTLGIKPVAFPWNICHGALSLYTATRTIRWIFTIRTIKTDIDSYAVTNSPNVITFTGDGARIG